MASPENWLELLATAKALFETAGSAIRFLSALRHYLKDPETVAESHRVSEVFSTYSEAEIRTAIRRLNECREHFIREGSGRQRIRCFCSVFDDFKIGNGGRLPQINDWQRMYHQLGCDKLQE